MTDLRQTQGTTGNSAIPRFDAHTPYQVFEREHRLLREGIAGLRSALLSDKFSGSARLGEQVDGVRSQLAVHFAFEEDYGFKHYLQLLRPAVAPEIDRLHREHREILTVLTSVSTRLNNGLSCADVRADLISVLEQLANHEIDERKVVLGTLWS